MPALLDKPERWRKRAEEIRTIADGMRDPEAKRFMLGLAKSHEELAKRAEDRQRMVGRSGSKRQGQPYWLYRLIKRLGRECLVMAPSFTPKNHATA